MNFFVLKPSMWAHWPKDGRDLPLHLFISVLYSISAWHAEHAELRCSLQRAIPTTCPLSVSFIKEWQNGRKSRQRKEADVQSNALPEEERLKEYRTECEGEEKLTVHAGFLMTDVVWTSPVTTNASCKTSVMMALNYIIFAAQQV